MSRITDIIRRVEQREPIDLDQELTLMMLDVAQQGEQFADEMIRLIESLDDAHRYAELEQIELFESGQVKTLHFRGTDAASSEEKPANDRE
jgi:hypothetical protein